MILSWLKNRRRRKWLAQPLGDAWAGFLQANVRHYRYLSEPGRRRIQDVVRVMVAEKHFCGGGGLQVTDEMKVTIAAQAALLTLGLEQPYFFDRVQSIIVHPGAFARPADLQSHHVVVSEQLPLLGEAWHHGPLVLSWRHVLDGGRDAADGMNVVLHEFAHHLDGLDGAVEGMPPLAGRERQRTWYRVTEAEYLRLVGNARRGDVTLLDQYGATDRAEFFAVATECFFERPHALRDRHRELYEVLGDFFQQDPAQWLPDATVGASGYQRPAGDGGNLPEEPEADDTDAIDPSVYRSKNTDELFAWGVDCLNEGRYRAAEAAFSRVVQSDPEDAEAFCQRALARLQLDKHKKALADSQRALQLSPDDTDALQTRGAAYVALGQYEQALDDLTRVPASMSDAETMYLRGVAWLALDRPRRAVRDFSAAIRQDPYDAEAYFQRSQAYSAMGRAKRAEADLEKALQLDPHLGVG